MRVSPVWPSTIVMPVARLAIQRDICSEIKAPPMPGEYVLEIDLVQEGVTFFKDKGSPTWRARVKVE